LTEGQFSPKHSGVRSLFDQSWIATGRLPKDMGRFYRHLFDSRQKGDYDDLATFGPAEVRSWIDTAARFIEHVSVVIDPRVQGEPETQ
jgi:uncharacterized protein (UPF0332 family)